MNRYQDELTPDVVSTQSGTLEAQTYKLTIGVRRCGRQFSGSTHVHTQKVFAELIARYFVSIEIECIP